MSIIIFGILWSGSIIILAVSSFAVHLIIILWINWHAVHIIVINYHNDNNGRSYQYDDHQLLSSLLFCSLFTIVISMIDRCHHYCHCDAEQEPWQNCDISSYFRQFPTWLNVFLWQNNKLPRLPINEELSILIPICGKSTYSKLFTMPPSSQLCFIPYPKKVSRGAFWVAIVFFPSSEFSRSAPFFATDLTLICGAKKHHLYWHQRSHREAASAGGADGFSWCSHGSVVKSRGIPQIYASTRV